MSADKNVNKITGDEPINPTTWDDRNKPEFIRDNDGLTIRQYYAGLAMQGLCANLDIGKNNNEGTTAMLAVNQADALIAELN